ncbi:MAG: GNAT family N-acetyltransferase, partial [Thermomicrobiales bacterium]
MNQNLKIRRATERDLKAIVELLIDDQFGAERESLDDLAPYLTAFQSIDADPNQLLVVMERDGAIIGTQHLTFMPGLSFKGATRLQVEEVRIAASERGGGLGTILIEWAIEQARDRGCNVVQLTSNAARIDAHRFYRRLGFAQSHAGFKL